MPQTQQFDKFAKDPKSGQLWGLSDNQWVKITPEQYRAAHGTAQSAEPKSPFPFTGPNAIQDAIAWVKAHPKEMPGYVEQSKQEERQQAPPLVAGLATLPFGGEGIWPLVARIAASSGAAGLTDLGLGGNKKEAAVTAAEQGGLQGAGEGIGSVIGKLAKYVLSKAPPKVIVGGAEFPLVRGQQEVTPTVAGKITRGMGESFVGTPISSRLTAQDTAFKSLISKSAEAIGGVRGSDPANFVENTFDNAKALVNRASQNYNAIREALPNELSAEQIRRQSLESAAVFKGKGAVGASDLKELFRHANPRDVDSIIANLKRSGFSDDEIYGENEELKEMTEGKLLTPRGEFTALQKLRSQTAQAMSQAYKRGMSGGSFADYAELRSDVERVDRQIAASLERYNPKLAKQFFAAKAIHAQGRSLEEFGTMLDSLTSGLSRAEYGSAGLPSSELHPQAINYSQALEKIREFSAKSRFGTSDGLQKLFGKQGAQDILRTVNLIGNAAKSNMGIIARYATTYGPAVEGAAQILRGRPEEAAFSLAAYPALWAVAKLLSYPSFAEPFGKFLRAGAGSKDAALWLVRSEQAARKVTGTQ